MNTDEIKPTIEITDVDVRITRIAMGIKSTTIIHRGYRLSETEAQNIANLVVRNDRFTAQAFAARFALASA